MITSYLMAGGLCILIFSYYRYLLLRQRGEFHKGILALVSIPKTNGDRGEELIAIGQGMGLLWILQGVFWMVAEDTLSGNIIWTFAEAFGILLPPIAGTLLLKALAGRRIRK